MNKFNDKLEDYFFYNDNGKIKKRNPKNIEFNEIEKVYISLLDKNIEIKQIKEYLENYIEFAVRPEMEKLNDADKKQVNNRIYRIRNLIKSLKPNTNKKKYQNY